MRLDLRLESGLNIQVSGPQQRRVRWSDAEFVVHAVGPCPQRSIEALLDHDLAATPGPAIGLGRQCQGSAGPADCRIGFYSTTVVEAEHGLGRDISRPGTPGWRLDRRRHTEALVVAWQIPSQKVICAIGRVDPGSAQFRAETILEGAP
jgi:hypothetical protein